MRNTDQSTDQLTATTKPLGLGDLCVGLATPPVIVAAIGLQWGGSLLAQVSALGDDLWRGERLPILHFPAQPRQ
jgi:hypothetical protein